ncbi:MAG: glycoside hydrolase family 88 protein [Ignavibacteriales bacterium]|nr:glycoside hydrolase family 88 protein [Ignavibacteriales bacterium]
MSVILLLVLIGCSSVNTSKKEVIAITPEILVNSFIDIYPDTVAYKTEAKSYKWNYEQGLILESIYRLWINTKEEKYFNYIKKNIDYYVNDDGSIKTYDLNNFNIDNIASGRVLLHLYETTKQKKYKIAADNLIKQLKLHPRTSEGGFWHKKIYPNQMWLDGLYMAEPFYSEYSVMFSSRGNFDDIANQFLLIKKHLYDKKTGLYFHGWDESKQQKWADPIKGTSPNFWGRSLGWVMMAMVDVLDSFPENHKDRNEILKMFQELSSSLLKYQNEKSKLWYQVVDKSNQKGNYIETSASSMFIYAFAKGYNKGYLEEHFKEAAKESFSSLVKNFIIEDNDGRYVLTNVCSVGGLGGNPYRDGSFEYYISEPKRDNDFKGYGALILAAHEIIKIE